MSTINSAVPPVNETGRGQPTMGMPDVGAMQVNTAMLSRPRAFHPRNANGRDLTPGQQFRSVGDDISGTLLGPIRFALLYWIATFVIFLFSNLTAEVRNMPTLVLFVAACFIAFYLGYHLGVARHLRERLCAPVPAFGRSGIEVALVFGGSLYFILWGINQLVEFELTNPVDIAQAVLSPGEAYKAKFAIAEGRFNSQYSSTLGQVLVITSLFYAIFVPLVVAAWSSLPKVLRLFGLMGIAFYVVSFLAIGTLKGLGDVVLFVVAGASVAIAKRRVVSGAIISRRRILITLALVGSAFLAYMLVSQVQRAEEFQIIESPIVGDVSQTFIAKQFGHEAAYGLYTILAYPSHGYAGLAFNLEQPFVFSGGAGLSLAFESYRQQYFGSGDRRFLTYPFRTELATGWSAQMFWSTALPWLASDVSFFGVPFLLALIGFLYARLWLASLYGNNPLALGGLALMIMFIAFMPANNQVLFSRQGLWAVVTLALAGILTASMRRKTAR